VSQDRVAEYLRASDLLLLSSAYEGMPRCVVESLGCGVPVVTTDAGEVTLLVKNDINGYIIEDHSPDTFANSIVKALGKLEGLRGQPCLDSVDIYRADIVLSNLYETYRHYAK
jgi:glycosyltransferase involved in cell wall biosynthesis